jgi:hypothetical protein
MDAACDMYVRADDARQAAELDRSRGNAVLIASALAMKDKAATLARDALKDERQQLEQKRKQLSEDASLVAFVAKKVMDREKELEIITAGLVQPQSHDYMADLDAVENYRSPKEYGNGLGY